MTQNVRLLTNRSKRMTPKQCGNKSFCTRRRERKEKTLIQESGVKTPEPKSSQDKAPETPSGCGSLRTPESQKPLRPPQPHRLAAGGSPTSHRNQPHPWVPHPGPLLKRAQGTRVSEPTYQEHVLGFIIPGQQDKLSQQVSFQTGASEKAGGGYSIYMMFQMMRLVSRHSARSDQI